MESNPLAAERHPWATGPAVAFVRNIVDQRHPEFRRRDIPGRFAVLTLVMNSRGEVERSALIENEEAAVPITISAEFLASQFPGVVWDLKQFRRGGSASLTSAVFGPDPLLVLWLERR